MGFNADAFVKAREPWVLTIGGRSYPGRPVSVPEVLGFQQRIKDAGADADAVSKELYRFLRLIFPERWSYVWQGDPVRKVLRLDVAAQAALLTDFFEYLAQMLSRSGTKTPPSPPLSAPRPQPTLEAAPATA